MNAQFKKGVLELIVLESVRQKDMYGYELVEEVSKVVDVNEGTIYPLLKRMTNEHYFETYLRESTEGPPRKYYHITAAGILYRDSLERDLSLIHIFRIKASSAGILHLRRGYGLQKCALDGWKAGYHRLGMPGLWESAFGNVPAGLKLVRRHGMQYGL